MHGYIKHRKIIYDRQEMTSLVEEGSTRDSQTTSNNVIEEKENVKNNLI